MGLRCWLSFCCACRVGRVVVCRVGGSEGCVDSWLLSLGDLNTCTLAYKQTVQAYQASRFAVLVFADLLVAVVAHVLAEGVLDAISEILEVSPSTALYYP